MRTHNKQKGTVMVVGLIFLLLTATISTTVMKTSILEVKMAGNEQLREEAFQQTQAITNAISANSNNLVVAGDIGYKICATGASGCDAAVISLNSVVTTVPAGASVDYHATRLGPLFAPLPFRLSEGAAGSATAYVGAKFEVYASYDGAGAGLGNSDIAQGIIMRVAAAAQ